MAAHGARSRLSVRPVSVVSPDPDVDLSNAGLPIGPVLEAAFREAVTEMALLTPERIFLRVNPPMCRLLGRTEAELTGLRLEDIAHPDDRDSVLVALEEARSGFLRGFRIWGRCVRADGSVVPVLVAITMLRDEIGGELCFFVQVLDAEASPAAPLSPDLEHQPVVDFTCDREGRLVGVSPVAKLFGWNPEELQSVATLDLVHPADRARAEAALHAIILQPGVPIALPPLRFRDREGAWWPVERAYFARELHDGLGQILTSLSLFARSIEGELNGHQRRRLAALRVLADEALATTRSLAWSLRASSAPLEGLEASLRSLARTISSRTGLAISISGSIEARFAVRVEAAVYKIVEEALTNVMRHASAEAARISLRHDGDVLAVIIEDDGAGFEPEQRTLTPGSGMGLLCMEERARLVDGTLRISSRPGQGTVVCATLPVPPPGSPPIGRDGVAVRSGEGRR